MVAVSFVLINRRCAFHHTSARACVCFFLWCLFSPTPSFSFGHHPPPPPYYTTKNTTHTTKYGQSFLSLFAVREWGRERGRRAGHVGVPPSGVTRWGVRCAPVLGPRRPGDHAHVGGHVEVTLFFGLDVHDVKFVGGQRDDLPAVGDDDVVSAAAGPRPGEREAHNLASVSSKARRLFRRMSR